MKTQMLSANSPGAIDRALAILKEGGLAAFPTDTVYGLGALAFDAQAIDRLFIAKGRDTAKAIAVLLGQVEHLNLVTQEMNETARRLAEHFWPGPLTLVVPRHSALPSNLSPLPTIGVRMPDHPVAIALLTRSGPLAVTSANLSGEANLATAQEVLQQLGGRIPLILDGGRSPGGQPSTVVDCTQPELVILRQGPITLEKLRTVLS
jgi:L-threonylcarbamoyladenylate synthase